MNRRRLLVGIVGLITAPAIVRAETLMKVAVQPRQTTLVIPPEQIEFPEGWGKVGSLVIRIEINGDNIQTVGTAQLIETLEQKIEMTSIEWDRLPTG